MKKRMAILMSMAIAANMIASVPVCAADIFTDSNDYGFSDHTGDR